MTRLGLCPYRADDDPPPGSVPVSVVVLTRDEEVNIGRCLASVAWADQIIVVDSGSTDATVPIARSLGAGVVEQAWLGFSGQREFALRLPDLRHDWVYFVDADEWVSSQLAAEIAAQLAAPACAAFAQRFRLVFQGTWIRHCGWYSGSWIVRLVDRRYTKFDGSLVGERARVDGPVRSLANDIVDEDHKGLAAWLHKHVRYAQLEAQRRGHPVSPLTRLRRIRTRVPADTRPLIRSVLRDVIFPSIPAKPAALFIYMYVFGLGLLDGRAGLRFCLYHAWYQSTVGALQAETKALSVMPLPRTLENRKSNMLIKQRGTRAPSVGGTISRPRLGVLATHPIQYQAPLYQELARRGVVDLEVAFLSSRGAQPYRDPGFGVTVTWDVDLLAGYRWILLPRKPLVAKAAWLLSVSRWLRRKDIVVLHGHADPETLLAVAACRILRVPYLLRGESHAGSGAIGWRRIARHLLATFVVRGAAGALPIGRLNAAFYDRYGRIPQYIAPYSVDNDRFRTMSDAARSSRVERLESLGLDPRRPTVIFSGKLVPQKRPLDAVHAIAHSGGALNLVMLGDGPLREEVRRYERCLPVRCLGFVNQAELPAWYASGDVLVLPSGREPWGVVVNEGMACGLTPVVSDAVGCASDLVHGVGEIFPVGDVEALAGALLRASNDARARHEKIRCRLAGYTVTETAKSYEQAALQLTSRAREELALAPSVPTGEALVVREVHATA